jgi:iron-sulfur cluster repair protein YtfE (RIC family)
MDAIDLLKQQHREALSLLERLEGTAARRSSARSELFEQLRDALTLHTKIEEEVFYPALENFTETSALIKESYAEHRHVDELLERMSSAEQANNTDWPQLLAELKRAVTHHVDEEENQLFPQAARLLTRDQLADMTNEMRGIRTRQSSEDQLIYPAARLGRP